MGDEPQKRVEKGCPLEVGALKKQMIQAAANAIKYSFTYVYHSMCLTDN
jgi:hypothetical protein